MPLISPADAADLLRAGGIVAIPTETVYGLAASIAHPDAVAAVFRAKGRPPGHPLIVHVADLPSPLAEPDPRVAALRPLWPGPLSVVLWRAWLDGRPLVPDVVTGARETVALRVPAHPVALDLIRRAGPLAAPSANRFGQISPSTARHVLDSFPDLPVVDGGDCNIGVESTILDLSSETPALLRPGGVSVEELERRIGRLAHTSQTAAPGTLPAHYAPRTPLKLCKNVDQERLNHRGNIGILRASPVDVYARGLYAALRRLDAEGFDILLVEEAEEIGIGVAVNDRLRRAEVGSGGKGEG